MAIPPAQSSVPPLKEQGDYCAGRGMDYLAAFWKVLTQAEKQRIGKFTLSAWKSIAREVDAGRKTPSPAAMPDAARDPHVPERYLAALARLQVRKPEEVSDMQWRQAIDDAGKFLDELAKRAADYGWTDRDVFDPPCRGVPGGLIWSLARTGTGCCGANATMHN